MRFKCISKWWCDLITSSRFVAKHLSIAKQSRPSTFCVLIKRLVCQEDAETKKPKIIFSLLNFSYEIDTNVGGGELCTHLSSVEDLTNFPPNGVDVESLSIIGHCDGIVCLASHQPASQVCLPWNPAIQEFKILPQEPFLPDWSKVNRTFDNLPYMPRHMNESIMGFGYDTKSRDYKVIDIGFSGSKLYGDPKFYGGHVIVYPPKAVVYSLGMDLILGERSRLNLSLERETTYLWPNTIFQLYFKGMCYWTGYEQQKEFFSAFDTDREENELIQHVIISFDTSDEVFHEVLLPYGLLEHNHFGSFDLGLHLTLWNESVALIGLHYSHVDGRYIATMWVMNDDCAQGANWTKHSTFEFQDYFPHSLPSKVLAFWKSNEILGVGENGILFCYNITTNNKNCLPIQSVPHYGPFGRPCFYFVCGITDVKSVVPIVNNHARHAPPLI